MARTKQTKRVVTKHTRRSPNPPHPIRPPSSSPSPSPPPAPAPTVVKECRTFSLDYKSGIKVVKLRNFGGPTTLRTQSSYPRRTGPPLPEDILIFSCFTRKIHYSDHSYYYELWTRGYDNNGNLNHESRSAINHSSTGRIEPLGSIWLDDEENNFWRGEWLDEDENNEWRDEWIERDD